MSDRTNQSTVEHAIVIDDDAKRRLDAILPPRHRAPSTGPFPPARGAWQSRTLYIPLVDEDDDE